jgi:hypothetical protein
MILPTWPRQPSSCRCINQLAPTAACRTSPVLYLLNTIPVSAALGRMLRRLLQLQLCDDRSPSCSRQSSCSGMMTGAAVLKHQAPAFFSYVAGHESCVRVKELWFMQTAPLPVLVTVCCSEAVALDGLPQLVTVFRCCCNHESPQFCVSTAVPQ